MKKILKALSSLFSRKFVSVDEIRYLADLTHQISVWKAAAPNYHIF